MAITRILVVLMLIFTQGCVSMHPKAPSYAYIANGAKFELLSMQKLDKYTTLNQLLKGKYKDKSYSVNLVTQFSPDEMRTIGLTKFGSRIFTISYNNQNIDFVPTPLVPAVAQIHPEYMLADMQLVYWPIESIKRNLKDGMTVTESPLQRVFLKDGKPVIEITYSKKNKWQSKIHYRHLERKYEYTIENL
jgi:hypothetical protein